MEFGKLKSLLEGKFEPEQIASLMEFALAIVQMRETEDYRRLWQTLEHMGQKIDQLTDSVQNLQSIVNNQAQNISWLTQEVIGLKNSVEGLVQITERHSHEISELRKTVEGLIQITSQHTQEISQHSHEISELRKTVEKLVQVTSQHTQEIHELKNIVSQHSHEISELRKAVERLIQITERHSHEIDELRKTTKELVEAIEKLSHEHRKTREQPGGLSHTVGYVLENQAYRHLPRLLKEEGIEVIGKLKRGFIEYSETSYDEVNILGKAIKDGVGVFIIGEGKTQLNKKHIDEFLKKLHRIERYLDAEVVPVMVTHMVSSPQTERYAKEKGIKLYYSYEFEE